VSAKFRMERAHARQRKAINLYRQSPHLERLEQLLKTAARSSEESEFKRDAVARLVAEIEALENSLSG
jgi:hypothetical protein